MDENITKYLAENKSKYSAEILRDALLKAGYAGADVEKGINLIYGRRQTQQNILPAKNVWDFGGKMEYHKSSEKLADFLLGFGAFVILAFFSQASFILGSMLFYLAGIFLAVYFINRRAFLAVGIIVGLIVGPIISGIIMNLFNWDYLF